MQSSTLSLGRREQHALEMDPTLMQLEDRWFTAGLQGGLLTRSFECFSVGIAEEDYLNRALFMEHWWMWQSRSGMMSAQAEEEIMGCIRKTLNNKKQAVARERLKQSKRASMFSACFLRYDLPVQVFDYAVPIVVGLVMPAAPPADRGPAFPHDAWNTYPLERGPHGRTIRPPCRTDVFVQTPAFSETLAHHYAIERAGLFARNCAQHRCCSSLRDVSDDSKANLLSSLARHRQLGCWHNGSNWETAFRKQHMATMSTRPLQHEQSCCNQLMVTNQVGVYSQHLRNAIALYYVNNTPQDETHSFLAPDLRRQSGHSNLEKQDQTFRGSTSSTTGRPGTHDEERDPFSWQRCQPPAPTPGSPEFRLVAAAAARAYDFAVMARDLIANEKLLAGADSSSSQRLPIVQLRLGQGFSSPAG
eukprot:6206080-Pleurochrysis_carterae.AAC.2